MTESPMGASSAHSRPELKSHMAARIAPPFAILFGMVLLFLASNAGLSPLGQAYLSVGSLLCAFLIRRRSGHPAVLFLIGLSTFMSLRYILWRVFHTLTFQGWISTTLMLLLLGAEIYSWIILYLGYVQLAWPLNRKPLPLPKDRSVWPSVDVFIPTYNEDLFVVRNTVLAATALDWPADRLKIYLLDDGRRPEFAAFAREAGVGYITRPDNRHAKAGNLNHALKHTSGDLVAIFDCDHVPVKSFLTRTAGWMVFNPRIALLQTPHYFYSPDPFQRNLEMTDRTPPENNLFYGLIQPGNDFWDSTIFCGSCALLRREALDEIHGFAIETVTEDAHTSLKIQRKGWETAYLREALAGGLATERLALHVSQRIRWARGMVQIFRLDNPLLGRGLKLGQRLCYLSAMLHFFFAIPRLIFILAPLAFLFLGQNIIYASPMAVLTYAAPHLLQALIAQSRIQGRWRHSMWNYVYETSIAAFVVPIVLMALIQPRRGVFNVTAKGGLVERNYLDARIVRPNVILAVILTAALGVGLHGLLTHSYTTTLFQTYAMNMLWVLANLLVVVAAITVGYERKQIRRAPRITASLAVTLSPVSADGQPVSADDQAEHFKAKTVDLSAGGLSLRMATPLPPNVRTVMVHYINRADDIRITVPASVIRQDNDLLRLEWRGRDVADERAIVEMIFCRGDAWSEWGNYVPDRPLQNLQLLSRHTIQFLFLMARHGYDVACHQFFSRVRRPDRQVHFEDAKSGTQRGYAPPSTLPETGPVPLAPGQTAPPKSA